MASQPNVIVILTDDQGYGDMSCHGHPVLRTPNIDRLYEQSVRLGSFHVSPMCAPTRGELMSGVHCLRNGAMATSLGRHLLKPDLPTMPSLFAGAGYATGIFGKWHLGDMYPYRPMDRGFQEAIYHHGFGLTGADDHWCNDYLNPYYRHNGELKQAEGYCTDFWFDSAMDWMGRQQAAGKPFLTYIPTNVPHFPMWVDDVYKEEFAAYGDTPQGFFGMIKEFDENLGRLEAFLEETGLRDNTILIYMTDNGHAGGALDVYNAGMRGGKCSRYEGGHRVPCFIRWPAGDLLPAGEVATPTHGRDILPTLLELCGIDAGDVSFDGESLAPMLRGQSHDLDERISVVQYFQNSIAKDDACVIWKQWRLVFGKELYDLEQDPGQEQDIAGEHPEIVTKLKGFYDQWWAEVEPGIHVFSPITVGSPHENPVTMTSCEWQNVRCDGIGSVREASRREENPRGGPWNIDVATAGTYTVELRRWPVEAGLALDAPAAAFQAAYGEIEPGIALPVATVALEHEGQIHEQAAPSGAQAASFTLELPAGRTQLQGWFRDADGNDICGAFYGYVRLEP